MKAIIRRITAHPSARACCLILGLFAAMAFAEFLCCLRGVGSM